MTSTILVTDGTGTLGRLVVPLLRDAGARVRVLSRCAAAPGDGIEHLTGDLAVAGPGGPPARVQATDELPDVLLRRVHPR